MPVMNFDLQDGKPPVTFSLKSEDCDRFMAFMDECQAIKEQRREWVGLTEEEENELWESTDSDWELMKRTEAKLREKNA